jgi:hypothetical protein
MIVAKRRAAQGVRQILLSAVLAGSAALTFATSASAEGSFVIGDGNAAVGSSVQFWGAQWWMTNSLSGGFAPASFKGFANSPNTPPKCGSTWSTRPGNSSEPPAGPLPELINVIVSSLVTKSGPTISGDTREVVVVRTDPGYASDPGHPGTGTVVAVACGGPEGGGPS